MTKTKISAIADFVFKVGVLLLPFENFIFAPSSGWATISPILFFLYTLLNLPQALQLSKKHISKILLAIGAITVLEIFNICLVGINISSFVNSLISLFLGLACFSSFIIYYQNHRSLKSIINLLLIGYSIALIFGVLEWGAIQFNIDPLLNFFDAISKRNYLIHNRIQFMFTEPSFIGMHLFGILLPIYLITKDRRLLYLIIAFLAAAIIFSSGIRIIIDSVAIGCIFIIARAIRKKQLRYIILAVGLAFGFTLVYNTNPRLQSIVDNGVYADGSLAARYYRINASVQGYIADFPQVLFGYGIGNSIIPIQSGSSEAQSTYQSRYLREVRELEDVNYNDESASYCMYTRIISEFGIITFLIILLFLINITKKSNLPYKWEYFATIVYLYIQFESYAFYAIWLYLAIMLFSSNQINAKNQTDREQP